MTGPGPADVLEDGGELGRCEERHLGQSGIGTRGPGKDNEKREH